VLAIDSSLKVSTPPVDGFAMAIVAALRRRLRVLARSERGMALPTALFAMIASFALASVAVLSSVDSQRGTARDSASKSAIAAADAGASVALLRLNRFQNKLNGLTPCIGPAGEVQTATAGWCPATTPETVGGATFSYRVSAFQSSQVSVVAVGAYGGVSRRINVKLGRKNGEPVFKAEQLIGESWIELIGGPTLKTNIGTNGGVILASEHGESAIICGNIRHGPGQPSPTPTGPPVCPEKGTVTEGSKTLPPVVPPENIATSNSDKRLIKCVSSGNPSECEADPYKDEKGQPKTRTTTDPWDAAQRFINIPNNATLTLGGGDYWVCGLFVNGNLVMAPKSQVRIFFDTPEHCIASGSKFKSSNTQVEVSASGSITSSSFGNCESNPEECRVPGLYVMGSPTTPTTVILTGNSGSTNELMLYAPYSNVELGGNATWIGMFAGKTIKMNGNPTIKTDLRIPQPETYFPGLLERTRYVECTGATGSPPDVNC
jgi:Tfp pilus assembly protein PilX